MQDIQEVFQRIEKNKKELKDIKSVYKDALAGSQQYAEVTDELKRLREKKKQIETATRQQFSSECIKMEDIKIDIASDEELLSDIAMTKLMKGEPVEVNDQYQNQYEPVIRVRFKKMK